MKKPPIAVISLAIGAFLLPTVGGHLSIEGGQISKNENVMLAILGGEKAPLFAHCLISLFFLIPLLHAFFTRKIIHVPAITITGGAALLATSIGISVFWSSFKHTSAIALIDWALMIASYFAVTSNSGRKQGVWVLWGYVLGVCACALVGLIEFRDMRVIDPGYRISALQLGPNQAGTLFATGIGLSLPLMFTVDRIPKLLLGLGIALQAFALMLTQSKGAILCAPIGVIVFLVGIIALKPVSLAKAVPAIVLPLALAGLMTFAAQKAVQSPSGGSAPLARISNTSELNTQSAGFRKLLWQTAVELTQKQTHGWGIGTFGYESTRPGRVTQTTLAHQTYLQLGAEASLLAPLGLLAFFGMAIARSLRGLKNLPEQTKLALLACYAGIAAGLAHNFIDSDMYVFGLGASMFLLAGLVTALSVDSQAPELVFTMPRIAIAAAIAISIPLGLSLSYAELQRGLARGAIAERDLEGSVNHLNSALAASFSDGQAHFIRGRLLNEYKDVEAATSLHPSPKFFRTLADMHFAQSRPKEGFAALSKALERDPNNAPTLLRYMNAAIQQGEPELAEKTANRLIETETTTYFTVRSQAELVPTQTYEARIFLASVETKQARKSKLLAEAFRGFQSYRQLTVPLVLRSLNVDPDTDFAGESKDTITDKMKKQLAIISELKSVQRDVALDLEEEEAACAAILADLLK